MNENIKKGAAVIAVIVIAVILWLRMCGSCLYNDGSAADTARDRIQSAQGAAAQAGRDIESAEESNRNARESAGRIADSNGELEETTASIGELISRGESIVAEIRQGGEKDSEKA